MSDYLQSDIMQRTAPTGAFKRRALIKRAVYLGAAFAVMAGLIGGGYYVVMMMDSPSQEVASAKNQSDLADQAPINQETAQSRKQKVLENLRQSQKQDSGIRSTPIQAGNDQIFVETTHSSRQDVPPPLANDDKMVLPSFTDLPETKEELQAVGRDTLSKVEEALQAANSVADKAQRLTTKRIEVKDRTPSTTDTQQDDRVAEAKTKAESPKQPEATSQSDPDSGVASDATAQVPAAAGEQAYAVQIASYKSIANARNIARKLHKANIDTKFVKSGSWTIVRTSVGQSRQGALQTRQQIAQRFGIKPLLIKVGHETGQAVKIVAAPKLKQETTQAVARSAQAVNNQPRRQQKQEISQQAAANLPTGLSQRPPENLRDASRLRPGQPEIVIVSEDTAIPKKAAQKIAAAKRSDPTEISPALQYQADQLKKGRQITASSGQPRPVSPQERSPALASKSDNQQKLPAPARPAREPAPKASPTQSPKLAALPAPRSTLATAETSIGSTPERSPALSRPAPVDPPAQSAEQPPMTIQETLNQADKSLRNNQIGQARRLYNDVLSRTPPKRPEYLRALTAMTGLIAEDSPVEALAFLREQETKSPDSSMISAQMAAILAGIGNINGAVAMQQQAVIREPGNPAHVLDLASLYERAGLQEQARQAYDIVLKSHKAKQELPDQVFKSAEKRYQQLLAQEAQSKAQN